MCSIWRVKACPTGHWRTRRDRGSGGEQLRGESFLRKLKESELERRVDTATGKQTLDCSCLKSCPQLCNLSRTCFFSLQTFSTTCREGFTNSQLRLTNWAPTLKSVTSDLNQVDAVGIIVGAFYSHICVLVEKKQLLLLSFAS